LSTINRLQVGFLGLDINGGQFWRESERKRSESKRGTRIRRRRRRTRTRTRMRTSLSVHLLLYLFCQFLPFYCSSRNLDENKMF
jgi:hypothetical protein